MKDMNEQEYRISGVEVFSFFRQLGVNYTELKPQNMFYEIFLK